MNKTPLSTCVVGLVYLSSATSMVILGVLRVTPLFSTAQTESLNPIIWYSSYWSLEPCHKTSQKSLDINGLTAIQLELDLLIQYLFMGLWVCARLSAKHEGLFRKTNGDGRCEKSEGRNHVFLIKNWIYWDLMKHSYTQNVLWCRVIQFSQHGHERLLWRDKI